MTDDELERALFALPLEEAPADLRGRILAATIHRPALTFAAWEIWVAGTLVAFTVWLAFLVATSVPDLGASVGGALADGVRRLVAALSPAALLWAGLGMSLVVSVSMLSLPASRHRVPDRGSR